MDNNLDKRMRDAVLLARQIAYYGKTVDGSLVDRSEPTEWDYMVLDLLIKEGKTKDPRSAHIGTKCSLDD